jgi:predicted esterase
MSSSADPHPHQGTPLQSLGSELSQAKSAMILLHGRGASAEDILGLAQAFTLPADMIVLAPQARGSTWYPQRLIAPLEMNEPYLSSALKRVSEVVALLQQSSIPAEKIIIGGFSQGASLSIEFVLRNSRRWGGLLAFSGGHIWPLDIPRQPAAGSLAGTPVFLGCSDVDPHIPLARVEETESLLTTMGAQVTKRIYPGMGHSINQDEIDTAQALISALS